MEKLYINHNMLFKDKLPQDLYTVFQIIKLLIEQGNLNLIHNKNSYQHFNSISRKRKLVKLYNEMKFMDYKARFHISTLYTSNFINPILPTSQHPYIQETRKFDTWFHSKYKKLHTQTGKQIQNKQ